MRRWTKKQIGARVDELAREHQGDAFVAAIQRFGREELDKRERGHLYDALIARARRGRIGDAARERARGGWTRRMLEGRIGRRVRIAGRAKGESPPPDHPS